MRSTGGNLEEEEEEDEELVSKKEITPSNIKDAKNNDKAYAIRSKHSVTEQRRRSKINERFQMLRDLIPDSDQKRDTASFLLEVIEYVQYLQEKVQKYEGSYQGWSSEPAKLMPWRNSHRQVQSLVGHPQSTKNGSGLGSAFPGRFEENNITINSAIQSTPLDLNGSDCCKMENQQPEFANKSTAMPMPLQASASVPVQGDDTTHHPHQRPASDAQSTECPVVSEGITQQEEPMIEGGTISISSVYSEGLLKNLTQALQNTGVDVSESTISILIDLGKQANRQRTSVTVNPESALLNQSMGQFRDGSTSVDQIKLRRN